MPTFTKQPPVWNVFEGSGSNVTLIGTVTAIVNSAPLAFQFNPAGVPITDPNALITLGNRLAAINANPANP